MMSKEAIEILLYQKRQERDNILDNAHKKGNKGYNLPYLSAEIMLLKKILELK